MLNGLLVFVVPPCWQLRLEEERKEKKRAKERERKERRKAEGKPVTRAEREKHARAQAQLEALKAQGKPRDGGPECPGLTPRLSSLLGSMHILYASDQELDESLGTRQKNPILVIEFLKLKILLVVGAYYIHLHAVYLFNYDGSSLTPCIPN